MIGFLRRLFGRQPTAKPPLRLGPWGKGWKVLVFRYTDGDREELHVLAPVDGYSFDWEVLRPHVRGEPWPPLRHELGRKTAVLGWQGHHTFLDAGDGEPMRMNFSDLIPGRFGAGAGSSRCAMLEDVRDAVF